MIRRPIQLITITYLLGLIIQHQIRIDITLIIVLLFISIPITIYLLIKKRQLTVVLLISVFLMALLNTELHYKDNGELLYFKDREVEVYGTLIQKNPGVRDEYYFFVEKLKYGDTNYLIDEKSILKLKKKEVSYNNKKVLVKGIINEPSPARNPGMFDYKLYLRTKGINTVIYPVEKIKVLSEGNLGLKSLRISMVNYLYKKTEEIMGITIGRVALSMAFGDKSSIDEKIYGYFKDSGTAHILAVSGLHFGILFIFLKTFFKKIRLKNRYSSILLLIIIWFFVFLVGYPISGVRAAGMISLFIISDLFNRRYDIFTSLYLILLSSMIINPLIIYDISFQLSFFAVFAIGIYQKLIYDKLNVLPATIRSIVSLSVSAQIGIMPLMIYHFNTLNPWSVLFNIPIVYLTGLIMPLNLLLFITLALNLKLANLIGLINRALITILIKIAELIEVMPYSKILLPTPSITLIIMYYFTLLLIRYHFWDYNHKRKIKKKLIFVFYAILILGIIINNLYFKDLQVTFLDVGQGDCTLIETPTKTILIDGGNLHNKDLVTRVLLKKGISNLDIIAISHIHNDHIGGIIDVVENLRVGNIIIGSDYYTSEEWEKIKNIAKRRNITINRVYRGNTIDIDKELNIEVLHPSKEIIEYTTDSVNNNSLVFILKYKDIEILFTGDIEKEGIQSILKDNQYNVDIIKIPHHGSYQGTTPSLINTFNPKIAVIQVGKNTYGHPHESVLTLLEKNDILVYRNDKNGAIIIKRKGENRIEIETFLNID